MPSSLTRLPAATHCAGCSGSTPAGDGRTARRSRTWRPHALAGSGRPRGHPQFLAAIGGDRLVAHRGNRAVSSPGGTRRAGATLGRTRNQRTGPDGGRQHDGCARRNEPTRRDARPHDGGNCRGPRRPPAERAATSRPENRAELDRRFRLAPYRRRLRSSAPPTRCAASWVTSRRMSTAPRIHRSRRPPSFMPSSRRSTRSPTATDASDEPSSTRCWPAAGSPRTPSCPSVWRSRRCARPTSRV